MTPTRPPLWSKDRQKYQPSPGWLPGQPLHLRRARSTWCNRATCTGRGRGHPHTGRASDRTQQRGVRRHSASSQGSPLLPELSQHIRKGKLVTASSKHSSLVTSCRKWEAAGTEGEGCSVGKQDSGPNSGPHSRAG